MASLASYGEMNNHVNHLRQPLLVLQQRLGSGKTFMLIEHCMARLFEAHVIIIGHAIIADGRRLDAPSPITARPNESR